MTYISWASDFALYLTAVGWICLILGMKVQCVTEIDHMLPVGQCDLHFTVQCDLYFTVQCDLHFTVQCDLHFTVHCDLYFTVQCDLHFTVQCDLHFTVQCDLYFTVQCDLHFTVQWLFMHQIHCRFIGKARFRRAMLSCDSSYLFVCLLFITPA